MRNDSNTYDLIVIGAGSGGLNVGVFAARVGLKTLIIEKTERSIGGDCLNFGCVPSKSLIHIARNFAAGKSVERYGVKQVGETDIKAVMKYVDARKEIIREHENSTWLKEQGLDVALGVGKFTGTNQITVGDKAYTAKKIVIATGSKPKTIDLPGIDTAKLYNSDTIFDIDFLPKQFVFIGGGPISMELGQAFAMLGSKVTILERGDKFLPKEDREITEVLYERLKKDGITVLFNTEPLAVNPGSLKIKKADEETCIPFDALFVGIGRDLNIDELDVVKAGIQLDSSGKKIELDEYLRTTNPNVVVCGDAVGSFQFTHAAELHAGVIIRNFFSPLKKKISIDNLAWVTYTSPEIATFGLSESTLTQRHIFYEVLTESFSEEDRAITDEYRDSKAKLLVGKGGRILGGNMVAPHAGEIAQELILAQTHRMALSDLFKKNYPYPTMGRINKRIAGKFLSRKLTPNFSKLLRFMYRILN